ncbi:hypothetical protein IA938_07830 [Listeria welshimeri]|uniref:hypothetical protein n=1 Tax=Listeria welshimeri TaxID=1643 RepID=UPI001626B9EF|nr:hypothetical protein [Listeria welshimeri]MBC1410694.1 hypothetical protein [Listeria welshimeri]MBC1702631.1 hypothetical protein [Listeria welshimeri]MBC2299811.1 hypothetical protein [Listeria welshimeri]MBF2566568.1 hypothetical protein [Listeria welshimeri]MBS9367890.1 hypothetical protein [Listeria welshimeri]
MKKESIVNPKYKSKDSSLLYKYYAGFSDQFVLDTLSYSDLHEMTVLDPWNGSGTTSRIASQLGARKIVGLDINPVMTIISAAGLLNYADFNKINLIEKNRLTNNNIKNDPLGLWFTDTSIKNIRNVELEIRGEIIGDRTFDKQNYLAKQSGTFNLIVSNKLLAFYYLVFFETVKKLTYQFKSSNPTWIKVSKNEEEKIKISKRQFENIFFEELDNKENILRHSPKNISQHILLDTADSRVLPLADNSIDIVITSPPYCTRIDYAIATRVELAVLGINEKDDFNNLRKNMIGTTKILADAQDAFSQYSPTARLFLKTVYEHPSKASKSYYYKQFFQYFNGIIKSISEISRVSKKNAKVIIVVQDTFYKNVYLDIEKIFEEIFSRFAWQVDMKKDFIKNQTMVSLNNKIKNYREISKPRETVLIFERVKNIGDKGY